MTTAQLSARLSPFYMKQLDVLSKREGISKTDLLIEGIKEVLCARMDTHTHVLSEEEFNAVLDILDKPATDCVRKQLAKTMTTPYPWRNQ